MTEAILHVQETAVLLWILQYALAAKPYKGKKAPKLCRSGSVGFRAILINLGLWRICLEPDRLRTRVPLQLTPSINNPFEEDTHLKEAFMSPDKASGSVMGSTGSCAELILCCSEYQVVLQLWKEWRLSGGVCSLGCAFPNWRSLNYLDVSLEAPSVTCFNLRPYRRGCAGEISRIPYPCLNGKLMRCNSLTWAW